MPDWVISHLSIKSWKISRQTWQSYKQLTPQFDCDMGYEFQTGVLICVRYLQPPPPQQPQHLQASIFSSLCLRQKNSTDRLVLFPQLAHRTTMIEKSQTHSTGKHSSRSQFNFSEYSMHRAGSSALTPPTARLVSQHFTKAPPTKAGAPTRAQSCHGYGRTPL